MISIPSDCLVLERDDFPFLMNGTLDDREKLVDFVYLAEFDISTGRFFH